MAFSDDAQAAVDAAFAQFGRAAVYQALVGTQPDSFAAGLPVTLIPTTRDRELGAFAATSVLTDELLFQARASEIAGPKRNDRITLAGIGYRIHSDPVRRDRFGLVWQIGLRTER